MFNGLAAIERWYYDKIINKYLDSNKSKEGRHKKLPMKQPSAGQNELQTSPSVYHLASDSFFICYCHDYRCYLRYDAVAQQDTSCDLQALC